MPKAKTKSLERARRRAISKRTKLAWKDKEIRRRRSEGIRRAWANPEIRVKQLAAIRAGRTVETTKRQGKSLRKTLRKKSVKKRCIASQKRRWDTLGMREAHSKAMKKVMRNPEVRKKISITEKHQFRNGRKLSGAAITTSRVSKAEIAFAILLKKAKIKFISQFKIKQTRYTADFYIPSNNLVVEIDGHPFHYSEKGIAITEIRDYRIHQQGYQIIHLKRDSLNKGLEYCLAKIKKISIGFPDFIPKRYPRLAA